MDILQRSRLFAHSNRERIETHRAASEFMDERLDDPLVHLVEAVGIDVEHLERLGCGVPVHDATGADLGIVTDPAQEIVGDSRRAAGATGHLERPLVIDLHAEEAAGAKDDFPKFLGLVVIEPAVHPETGAQGRADHAGAGGRPDQGESGEVEPDAAGIRPLVDHDVHAEILHRRVEVLLDRGLQPVDLVDEEDTAPRHRGEKSGKVAGLLDGRAARGADLGSHGIAKDVGEGCLAEAGRAAQQDVLERFVTLPGRLDKKHQALDGLRLPAELLEHRGA